MPRKPPQKKRRFEPAPLPAFDDREVLDRQLALAMASVPAEIAGYAISKKQWGEIVHAVRSGCFFSTACNLAGVNYSTFQKWMKRGGAGAAPEDEPEGGWPEPYRSFYLAVSRAEAEAVALAEQAIVAHFATDWRAAAHYLSRKRPEEWGGKDSGGGSTNNQQVVVVLPSNNRDPEPEGGQEVEAEVREL